MLHLDAKMDRFKEELKLKLIDTSASFEEQSKLIKYLKVSCFYAALCLYFVKEDDTLWIRFWIYSFEALQCVLEAVQHCVCVFCVVWNTSFLPVNTHFSVLFWIIPNQFFCRFWSQILTRHGNALRLIIVGLKISYGSYKRNTSRRVCLCFRFVCDLY